MVDFFFAEKVKFTTYVNDKQDDIVTKLSDDLSPSRSNSAACSRVEG